MLGWMLGWKLIEQPPNCWEPLREPQGIFGSNSSQLVDYPTSIYQQWGFLLSEQEAAGRTQPLSGTKGAPRGNLSFVKLPQTLGDSPHKVTPCSAAAPSLSCATRAQQLPLPMEFSWRAEESK